MQKRTPSAVIDVNRVVHPPSWRGEAFCVDFMLLDCAYSNADLVEIYQWACNSGLKNPRAISPQTLSWSSLFQPRFFEAMRQKNACLSAPGMRIAGPQADSILDTQDSKIRFWIQSVVFLASVTMSAAIVQSRASEGTIASKYDKLWQVGMLQEMGHFPELGDTNLCSAVVALAGLQEIPRTQLLLDVRRLFEQVVEQLAGGIPAERVSMRQIERSDPRMMRFGFVDDLRGRVTGLRAIIVYGSSVSSETFADYDVVIVVDDAEAALRRLADASPQWGGKELNIGIYTPKELWNMQLLSGDNLANYGLCLFGEIELPEKEKPLLMARNLSFGMVRLRQQLGMIGHALAHPDSVGEDRRNLYNYFVKIAANVAKGTFGAAGQYWSKEDVHRWLREGCGFDAAKEVERIATHGPAFGLAAAAAATENTLWRLNEEFHVLTVG